METIEAVRTAPQPIAVGPEMAALRRFYPDVTWIGDIVEGGMGPSTPAMTARGCGIHESIQDGRWIVGTESPSGWRGVGSSIWSSSGPPAR